MGQKNVNLEINLFLKTLKLQIQTYILLYISSLIPSGISSEWQPFAPFYK